MLVPLVKVMLLPETVPVSVTATGPVPTEPITVTLIPLPVTLTDVDPPGAKVIFQFPLSGIMDVGARGTVDLVQLMMTAETRMAAITTKLKTLKRPIASSTVGVTNVF